MFGKWGVFVLSFVLLAGCFHTTAPAPTTSQTNGGRLDQTLVIGEKNGIVTFDLTVKNNGEKGVRLVFSNEPVSFAIVQKGNVIAHVGADSVSDRQHEVMLASSGQYHWRGVWDLHAVGRRVPAGIYQVEAELLPAKVNGEPPGPHQFLVKGTFEVQAEPASGRKPVKPVSMIENNAFRQLRVDGGGGNYRVTGKARVHEGVFSYAVTDGHRYLSRGQVQVEMGAPHWGPFTLELSIPHNQLPVNGMLILELYEESLKDGSRMHQKEIVLDVFRPE